MPGFLANLGMQAAGQATGAGMGLLLQRGQDRRQMNMQRKLQRMEMEGTKEMTDYNFKKQMEMWEATNYAAQIAQMKKANLSPGLIYGMGGAGGATTNVDTGHISGGQAPRGGGEAAGMGIAMGNMQLQLLDAQKKNIEADTNNKRAETALKPIQGTQIEATTESLLQGVENSKSQQALTEVQTVIASIDEYIKGKTQNAAVATIMKNLNILDNDEKISSATMAEKIKLITAELHNKIADTLNKEKQTAKSQKEIEEIDQKIKLLQQEYNINKVDEDMAKEGFNPKAGTVFKLIHNLVKLLMGL